MTKCNNTEKCTTEVQINKPKKYTKLRKCSKPPAVASCDARKELRWAYSTNPEHNVGLGAIKDWIVVAE